MQCTSIVICYVLTDLSLKLTFSPLHDPYDKTRIWHTSKNVRALQQQRNQWISKNPLSKEKFGLHRIRFFKRYIFCTILVHRVSQILLLRNMSFAARLPYHPPT